MITLLRCTLTILCHLNFLLTALKKFFETSLTIWKNWAIILGNYFGIFWFIKLLIDVIIVVVKAFQVNKLTGKTVGFSNVLPTAPYNLFICQCLRQFLG